MSATSVSVTDDVVREIGEQVSQTLRERLPKWGDTPLDLQKGIALYSNRADTFKDLKNIRKNQDGSKNKSDRQVSGKSFEELDKSARREEGKEVYTTDELAQMAKEDPDNHLFGRYPKLKKLAIKNHEQTDLVEIRRDGKIVTYQHKLYKDPYAGVTAFMKDAENDYFVVPHDQYDEYANALDERIKKGGVEARRARRIRKDLTKSKINFNDSHNAYLYSTKQTMQDASKRITANVTSGVISDVAVFAVGGAAWEIRDAYRNPDDASLLDRCKRLISAIWERLKTSLKDRSWREIGSEIFTGIVSVLTAPLKMAKAAISKIISVLRRLWMEFVDGKIKSLADLVAACLKALFVVASAGIALLLEAKLTPLMATIPGGDVLAAVIAAVVAGVMIVIGNRCIDGIVRALFGIFNAGAIARRRRQEIQKVCEEAIPRLIEDRERLQALVDSHFAERDALLDATFEDMQSARENQNFDGFLKTLITLNDAYGKVLPWASFEEFEEFLLDDSRTLKL